MFGGQKWVDKMLRGGSPMSDAMTQILAHLDGLSQQERADLAYTILCSLEPEDEGVAEAWDVELSRRVAEIRSGQAVGKPAEQLFAELRGKRA
jgi:putative addiction module component (TIGR02574 family)